MLFIVTVLLSDPRVSAVPVRESGEPMVRLSPAYGPAQAPVRASLASRLASAQTMLPRGLRLRVVEGHRPVGQQQAIIDRYSAEVRAAHPDAPPEALKSLVARFVSPIDVAPHVAGAAVDLTIVDSDGQELDLGTEIDATPETSNGACYFDSPLIDAAARYNRRLLAAALHSVGLVNYPTEWWHWSFGDRYWALGVSARYAVYGPVRETSAA
ncbi:D-alanyl-D-alanine dipeptidase [Kineosporia sp. NBRC 101677]|nr:D-alanyl-D-alanine dipeptidase [Kineosporia sp. NBRC 101677]